MDVRTGLATAVTGAVVVVLSLAACTGGGSDGGSGADGDQTSDRATAPDRKAVPADTSGPIKAAAKAAGSVVVTRTLTEADGDVTQEEIETAFTSPPSARVLHVGEEIWTLDVVEGVGYLKDQSERKSNNRWEKLGERETAERLEGATLDGLLGVLDAATSVSKASTADVRGVEATCHTFGLPATQGPKATARVCADDEERPVELVVTVGGRHHDVGVHELGSRRSTRWRRRSTWSTSRTRRTSPSRRRSPRQRLRPPLDPRGRRAVALGCDEPALRAVVDELERDASRGCPRAWRVATQFSAIRR